MSVSVKFAWYDMWVGLFVDRKEWRLYICPIPMLLITIQLPTDTRFHTFNRFSRQWERGLALGITPQMLATFHHLALYGNGCRPQSRGYIRRFAQLIDGEASTVAGRNGAARRDAQRTGGGE